MHLWWLLVLPSVFAVTVTMSMAGLMLYSRRRTAGHSGAKSTSGGCSADVDVGHEWVPQTDLLEGPVDVASLDWECHRCGDALRDEARRDELNGQVRDAARSLGAPG